MCLKEFYFFLKFIENRIEVEELTDDELASLEAYKRETELQFLSWNADYENKMIEEERLLEEREIQEENKFLSKIKKAKFS